VARKLAEAIQVSQLGLALRLLVRDKRGKVHPKQFIFSCNAKPDIQNISHETRLLSLES
jgi:hypothetical protein